MLLVLLTAAFLTGGPYAAVGQQSADELKRKEEEVNRLRRDLNAAQSELDQLKKENQRLRREKTRLPQAGAPAPSAAPAAAVPAVSALSPLQTAEIVDAATLVGQFLGDRAAGLRYTGNVFHVRGEIERFDTKLMQREYAVLFSTPDAAAQVVGRVSYVNDGYRTIYTADRGRKLVARTDRGVEQVLFQIGQTVTFKGRCRGLADGEIVFSGCQAVR